jgi:glycosyltransferase involved in cell wall biosynthesis
MALQNSPISSTPVHRSTADVNAAGGPPGRVLCLVHPLDPRSKKIGGIETHIRNMLRYAQDGCKILFVGIDSIGDLQLGKLTQMRSGTQKYDFLPILYVPDSELHNAAQVLNESLTLRFAIALARNVFLLRRQLSGSPVSVEAERFEFVPTLALLRRPIVLIVHGEGGKKDTMDSLLTRYWFIQNVSRFVAIRLASAIVCVNPNIKTDIERRLPGTRVPISFMPVPVDTEIFYPTAFDLSNGVFRIVFSGRLDKFKDPPTMFKAIHEARIRLGGQAEFHYIGTSNPYRYPEFGLIADMSVLHGYKDQIEIAEITRRCHAGVLTSFFEGMPCYLLETLSAGRPFSAIRLPQYDLVIEDGVSGHMIERRAPSPALEIAASLVRLWNEIRTGAFDPVRVHSKIRRFSLEKLLSTHFSIHRDLTSGKLRERV